MNLNEYLIENDKHIGDVVILNSVGTALDKVSGDTYPVYVDGGITFDDRDKGNLMDMDIVMIHMNGIEHYLLLIRKLLMKLWMICRISIMS